MSGQGQVYIFISVVLNSDGILSIVVLHNFNVRLAFFVKNEFGLQNTFTHVLGISLTVLTALLKTSVQRDAAAIGTNL